MAVSVKFARPEDAELSRKKEELAGLQSRLAELELQLLNLRLELAEFETQYCARVGPLYAELDEIEALIAEKLAQAHPRDAKVAEAANHARKRADESHKVVAEALTVSVQPSRPESLRDLYRTVAKRLHPDLATDDADRTIRERLMKEANLAYARGDEAKLRAILEEYESSPETVIGDDVAAQLVRIIRRISLANKRLQEIDKEIEEVKASELFKLKTLVEEGTQTGNDILGEMIERLKRQIDIKRQHLRSL